MSEQEVTAESTSTESVENSQDKSIEQQPETVPRAELDKVLNEMHRYKKSSKEFETKIKDFELNSLKEKEEWQKIAELKEQEASEAKDRADRLQSSFVNEKKFSAIKEAAVKMGIRKDAIGDLDLLDFDNVQIETTSTGRMNVLGADDAVKKLKMLKPHWFGKSVGNLNTEDPGGGVETSGTGITYKKLRELEMKAKESGDYTAYKKAIMEVKAHGIQR